MGSVRAVLRPVARVIVLVVQVLLGIATAVVGAFIAPGVLVAWGVVWPVGLVVALLLTAVGLGVAARDGGLTGAWAAVGGWFATILALSWPRPQGDIVIPGTWYGYAFMLGGMAIAFAVVARQWWRTIPAAGSASVAHPSDVGSAVR
jgi:hypothetical protein